MTDGWWQARLAATADRPRRHVIVSSPVHPDGTVVDVSAEQETAGVTAGWIAAGEYGPDGTVARLVVAEAVMPDGPPLWFVEVRESAGHPPAVVLLAYSEHGAPAGALLDATALSNLSVSRSDQLAAIRWYPATGEVDQIYVNPAWRRHRVGTGLIYATAALVGARGWARLWGDGQRTATGEQFRNASAWRHRTAELTHVAPPMTPGEPD
jgi:GNAT superfamily N-acetyltransferase